MDADQDTLSLAQTKPCSSPMGTTTARSTDSLSEPAGDSQEEERGQWEDWDEQDTPIPAFTVIRPGVMMPSIEAALEYDVATHDFCLRGLINRLELDTFARIKLINWIRRGELHGRSREELLKLTGKETWLLDGSDDLLIPQLEGDGLLRYDFGEDDSDLSKLEKSVNDLGPKSTLGNDPLGPEAYSERLASAQQDSERLKNLLYRLAHSDSPTTPESSTDLAFRTPKDTGSLRDDDTHYFSSYAHNDIHWVMIQDQVRTEAYEAFIKTNPKLFRGKRVMDIGCGTGILSFFAATAGAKKVYAIDASEIATNATEHMKQNGLSGQVTVIKKKVEDLKLDMDLDGERVDIIISEWMGYACLYEGFLPSVLQARDRFLKPRQDGGLMAPSQCSILMAGWGSEEWWKSRISWWDENEYGFKMGSTMTKRTFQEALVETIPLEYLVTPCVAVRDIHTTTLGAKGSHCIPFVQDFTLEYDPLLDWKSDRLCGFVVWFDTFFTSDGRFVNGVSLNQGLEWKSLLSEVAFSTGPAWPDTHWKQTLLVIKEPIQLTKGTLIQGTITCCSNSDNSREIVITIVWRIEKNERAQIWVL